MLHSAKIFRQTLDSEKFGVTCKEADFNLDAALAHKNDVICQLKCSIADSFECAGVKVIKAKAHIKSKADGLFITAAGENDIYSKICSSARVHDQGSLKFPARISQMCAMYIILMLCREAPRL